MKQLIALVFAVAFYFTCALSSVSGEDGEPSSDKLTQLTYEIEEYPENGQFLIPRQYARLHHVRWKGHDEDLKLIPEQQKWVIHLGKQPADTKTIVVSLLDPVALNPASLKAIELSPSESTTFPAHFADAYGEKLRYEPQPHKNCVGYWTVVGDWASWTISSAKPGTYNVEILQGCGKGHGGSVVRVIMTRDKKVVDEFDFTVEDTGHFQNFKKRTLSSLTIDEPGEYQLELRPRTIAKQAVMDVRQIVLTPQHSK